jgi:hypothetical protein
MSMHAIVKFGGIFRNSHSDRFACSAYGTKTAGTRSCEFVTNWKNRLSLPALTGAIARTRAF